MRYLIRTSLIAVLFLSAAVVAFGQGKVLTVTDPADSTDAVPGDGICADVLDRCTLRAAIEEANAEPVGRDVIVFSLHYPEIITLTLGPLTVTGNGVSIVGPGARKLIIERFTGGQSFRIFHVPNTGTTAMIRGMSIRNGISGVLIAGGAIRIGPGATVQLADASFFHHSGGSGGAILNEGTMTISRVLLASNAANLNGGAIQTTSTSTTRITDSTITNNSATNGGAIYAEGPVLSINNTIAGNSATMSASSIRSGAANEVAMMNTIVGNDDAPASGLSGSFLSYGNNLITDSRNSTGFTNGVLDDQVSAKNAINAQLGPLADNGGQTNTRALLAGSPAIDRGNGCVYFSECVNVPGPAPRLFWDQRRNHGRHSGGTVDIGSFEVGSSSVFGTGFFVSSSSGPVPPSFYNNSQAILINSETGERLYSSVGPSGVVRFEAVPFNAVYVFDFRSKRSVRMPTPRVLGFPD